MVVTFGQGMLTGEGQDLCAGIATIHGAVRWNLSPQMMLIAQKVKH